MSFKLFVALCALGIPLAQGYSNGAPDSECQSMTPRHHVDPQSTPAPYDFIISKKKIRAGETVELTVKGRGRDDTFKGLLVEARVGETPIGQFNVDQSRQYLQTISCDGGKNNAVTHKKLESAISEVKFKWTAPNNLQERVNFVYTVAKNGGVFWVAHKSETLNVA